MNEPRVVTTRSAFAETAHESPRAARVPVEIRVSVDDPFLAYRRARGREQTEGAEGVYLETTGGQAGWGYFATDPIFRLQVGDTLEPVGDTDPSPSLAELAGLLDRETLVRGDCDVPYPCGAFGWLSYDIARELEDLPDTTVDDRGLPRLQLGVFDRVAAWESGSADETTLRVTACPRVGDDPDAAYERGRERALDLARTAVAGDPSIGDAPIEADNATFESDCTPEEFTERVRRVKRYVRDGDTFQANVSQRLRAPAAVHPVAAFGALRRVNPAPYSALLEFPGVDLVSASPELLLDVDSAAQRAADSASGDQPRAADRLLTEPIAGTRPRGDTPEEDADLEHDLLTDEKERAEHAMLVDLERNDLGKVSEYGSVEVSEYRRVDRYSEVMHLVSLVEGRLRTDRDLVDAVAATFPGGTITGAPKPRTMEIIDEVETTRRGPYTGSIGVFGFDGRATLNMTIRTLVGRREEYFLRVGAGIVHDSEPDSEYAETLDKGRALITAIDDTLGDHGDLGIERATAADGGASTPDDGEAADR
ncbi:MULTISPECIES: anthranilate synthase component I family protein [Halococcus]|uniref:anthranilate synthase n=1 Tax=Halococcus salifodinae DSM 8989 TaxID=1227456 RepID=M0MUT0_9EURY|nr:MULTISPECIES: anthranilate synthase component I family protein [Halococcus]EMA49068.1 para-aminobenzoate synthase component I [Halococcus salifodinae DSM 8989]